MKNYRLMRVVAIVLVLASLAGIVSAAGYQTDLSGDGKVNVWDIQLAVKQEKEAAHKEAILDTILGGGDELHPNAAGEYEIWSALGLRNMANMTNDGTEGGKTFRLMRDIDMEGAVWYTPDVFAGVLEADGHVISNLTIVGERKLSSSAVCAGFFSKIGRTGAVRNLKLENANLVLTAESEANFIGLIAGSVVGEISNCTTIGSVTDPRTTLPAATYIGTLCGRIENVKDNPAVGITVTDESILMTAETAEITKISGKSQKVLCKMGMDFAALSYPEGTETDKQYKRQLGIAGWAPNYDNFKKYNWQDISGACTVEGGTGKIYDLVDPILTARRQATVDKMYEICTVEWTPAKDMTIYYYKVGTGETAGKLAYSTKTWKAGTVYRGMPYNHGSGSLERFYSWMDKGTTTDYVAKSTLPTESYYYTYTAIRTAMSNYTDTTLQTPLTFTDPDSGKTYDLLPGFKVAEPMAVGEKVAAADHAGFSRYIGNDCSQAISWAWKSVISNDVANGGTVISGVTQMCPTPAYQTQYGVLPVNGLVPAKYNLTAWNEMYETAGKQGLMEAYAHASRGDGLIVEQTPGGHSRMIAYDPICIRNYRGTIHATNSYIITHEQGHSSSGTDANGVKWSSTCSADLVYTFEALTDDADHTANKAEGYTCGKCAHYIPMTLPAFHDVDSKVVTSTLTCSSKGVLKSNFHIQSTTVDGVERYTNIGQHNNTNATTRVGAGYRDCHLQEDLTAIYGDLTGKTVTVRLSNGDLYTVNGDTFAVTKK